MKVDNWGLTRVREYVIFLAQAIYVKDGVLIRLGKDMTSMVIQSIVYIICQDT